MHHFANGPSSTLPKPLFLGHFRAFRHWHPQSSSVFTKSGGRFTKWCFSSPRCVPSFVSNQCFKRTIQNGSIPLFFYPMKKLTPTPSLRKRLLATALLPAFLIAACNSGSEASTETTNYGSSAPLYASANPIPAPLPPSNRAIRIGILLDTSNSMDGLINQAKAQLWRIVSELSKATVDGAEPRFEIALYEYGNTNIPQSDGYVRQVTPLTTNVDVVSADLFSLITNGGDEYCGTVIQSALTELDWSEVDNDLQVLIIAGNEPFNQGNTKYTDACKAAIKNGLLINTIFCGDYDEGVQTYWQHGAKLGNGHYANIDQSETVVYIETPFDDKLAELNTRLNSTYLAYGTKGSWYYANQTLQDNNARGLDKSIMTERTVAKSGGNYYNGEWDLVDASKNNDFDLSEVKTEQLPEEMKTMTEQERKEYIAAKKAEREAIQTQIGQLAAEREAYLAKHRQEQGETLGNALVHAIRKQAEAKGFSFDS